MSLPTRGIMTATSKQARRTANRHKRYWETQRSNLALCERSPRVSGDTIHSLKHQLLEIYEQTSTHNLGFINITNLHDPFAKIGLTKNMSYKDKKEFLEIPHYVPNPSADNEKLEDWLRQAAKQKQANHWNFRAGEAARFYSDLNWFPFFITLTVDPKIINPRKLWEEKNGWKNYIHKLAKISAKACGVKRDQINNISNRDYVAYFAQLEHGKSGVHDHIHALVWFRDIPSSWKMDPNFHLSGNAATNRRCPPLESVWQYSDPSQRPAIYFWHADCPWQRMGHKVPVDEKTGKGLVLLAPEYTGSYLSKYMSKETKPWHHQAKATHGIGLERITRNLKNMSTKELIQMARLKHHNLSHLVRTTISVPEGLLRSLAKQEIYFRTFHKMNYKELTDPRQKPFKKMQDSVEDGQRPWRMTSTDFSAWLASVLPQETNEYCEKTFFSAMQKLVADFRLRKKDIKTIGAL